MPSRSSQQDSFAANAMSLAFGARLSWHTNTSRARMRFSVMACGGRTRRP